MMDIKIILYLFVFFGKNVDKTHGLGWTDICAFSQTSTCYIWNGNPAPFNDPIAVLNSVVCQSGCILALNPYNGNCSSINECNGSGGISNGQNPAIPAFYFPSSVIINVDNITITSMDSFDSVQIQNGIDNAFFVNSQNVNLMKLNFIGVPEPNKPVSESATIIWKGGGTVSIMNLMSNSPYAVVLFVNINNFLNLIIDNIMLSNPGMSPVQLALPVSVVVLQVSNITLMCMQSQAKNSVFFLGTTWPPRNNTLPIQSCIENLNLTSLTNIAALPAMPSCGPTTIIQLNQNCPNPAIFATLVAILSIIAAALVLPLLFMYAERIQRKLHSNTIATTKSVDRT